MPLLFKAVKRYAQSETFMKVGVIFLLLMIFNSCHVQKAVLYPTSCVDSANKFVQLIELLDNRQSYHGKCVTTEGEFRVRHGLTHPICGLFGKRLIQTIDTPFLQEDYCGIWVEVKGHIWGEGLDSLNGRHLRLQGVIDTLRVPIANCWLATLKNASILFVEDSAR